jgi:hypothetical protein
MDTGCPDPHLKMAAHMMRGVEGMAERAWLAACYLAPYEVSTGYQIWHTWKLGEAIAAPDKFATWIEQKRSGFLIRRERRASYTVPKMVASMMSAAEWIHDKLPHLADATYDELWDASESLRYFGRYGRIKMLQTLHLGGCVRDSLPDIRPAGAWSPRQTLGLIFPEYAALLNEGGDRPEVLATVNSISEDLRARTAEASGRAVSIFTHEVLLCNYRQTVPVPGDAEEKKKKHIGWSLDTDLAYRDRARAYWSELAVPFEEVRASLFPPQVLGEKMGWDGNRDGIGMTFTRHGYFWSDMLYDYNATGDMANPVRR